MVQDYQTMVEQLLAPHITNVSTTFFESYGIEEESQQDEFTEIFTNILTAFTKDPSFNKIVNPPKAPVEAKVELDDLLNLVRSSEFTDQFNKANAPSTKKRMILVPKKKNVASVSIPTSSSEDSTRKTNIYNTFSSWIKSAYNNNKELNNGSKLGPKDFKEIWTAIKNSPDKLNQDAWMRHVTTYVESKGAEEQEEDA
jgi:hypothetical protein